MTTLPATPCPTYHKDGRVTFWRPRRQQWIERAVTVPPDALAILPAEEAARVRRHLWRQGVAV